MAAPTLRQIMDGIETRLKTISGLNTAAYVADQINPPQAVIAVPAIEDYHVTMKRGFMALQIQVFILTSGTMDREGQRTLADYADPASATSVVTAIEGDKTLGGVVDDCMVIDFRPTNTEEVGALRYYGGVFTLQVAAQGS